MHFLAQAKGCTERPEKMRAPTVNDQTPKQQEYFEFSDTPYEQRFKPETKSARHRYGEPRRPLSRQHAIRSYMLGVSGLTRTPNQLIKVVPSKVDWQCKVDPIGS